MTAIPAHHLSCTHRVGHGPPELLEMVVDTALDQVPRHGSERRQKSLVLTARGFDDALGESSHCLVTCGPLSRLFQSHLVQCGDECFDGRLGIEDLRLLRFHLFLAYLLSRQLKNVRMRQPTSSVAASHIAVLL